MNHSKELLTVLGIAALLAGCEANDVNDVKDPYVQQAKMSQPYTLDSDGQTFQNNKIFLWRTPLNPSVGTMILRAADNIDINEDAGIAERTVMNTIKDQLTAAQGQLSDAVTGASGLDDATKTLIAQTYGANNVLDTLSTQATPSEADDAIAKTQKSLSNAMADLANAAKVLPQDAQDTLSKIDQTTVEMAKIALALPFESDNSDWVTCRDDQDRADIQAQIAATQAKAAELKKQIDDLTAALPANLPAAVTVAVSARDALLTTLTGNYRDRFQSEEIFDQGSVPGLASKCLSKLAKLPALPEAVAQQKAAVAALLDAKTKQNKKVNAISKRGEELVGVIIDNTDYFNNTDSRFTFKTHKGEVSVSIDGFPEAGVSYSTEQGTVDNVVYKTAGGLLEFNVHPVKGADYYRFRLGRVRTDVTDGRLFYQGSMDLCRAGTICSDKLKQIVRHGVAKLVTSN